jgi:hypothetical protein
VAIPFLAATLLFGACRQHDVRLNSQTQVYKEFTNRVGTYVVLHRKLDAALPKLPTKAEPEQMAAHREALAQAIRRERANARQGDIFFDSATAQIRQIVRAELSGTGGEQVRHALREGNPPLEGKPVNIKVNANYPTSAPLSTMPPSLLLNLPKVPEEVEYRFVGRHLILRDVSANLIVDFIWEVTPRL